MQCDPQTAEVYRTHLPRNLSFVIPIAVAATLGWLTLNYFYVRPASRLPLLALDGWVPFLPWTVWPYAILLFCDPVLPLFLQSRRAFLVTLYAYVFSTGMNFAIWIAHPISYPRPPVPLDDSISAAAYRLLIAIDAGVSCFPSGHISIPTVLCWGLSLDHPRARPWLWGSLFVLAPTILTTKQHYFVDLLGGLAMGALGIALATAIVRFVHGLPAQPAQSSVHA